MLVYFLDLNLGEYKNGNCKELFEIHHFFFLSTLTDSNLTVDDLILNCSSTQSLTLNEYDVTLSVTYSPTFSPATIFAISFINVSRFEYNESDRLVPNGNGATLAHSLGHIDNVTLQSSAIATLSPLDLGHSYQFVVSNVA